MSNSKFQKKFSYIIFFSILCSYTLYFSNKNLFFTSENLRTRKLEGEDAIENNGDEENNGNEEMKDICSNGPDDLFSFYYEGTPYDTSDVESTKSEAVDALISIIEGNDLASNAKTYGMSALKWIIFIACGILMILGWLVCLICMCCNCCCCTCCCKKKICSIITFLLCTGCFAIVFVLSTHSFIAVKNAMKGMNGASCSLLQFIHEIIDGQSDKNQTSYWIGIDGINKVLDDVSSGIDKTIDNNALDFFRNKKTYNTYLTDAEGAINTGNNQNKVGGSDDLLSISINSSLTLIPQCVIFWGSTTTEGSYLSLAKLEYDNLKNSSNELVTEMNTNFVEITNCHYDEATDSKNCGESDVKQTIEDSRTGVNDMKEPINDLKDKISDPLIDYQNLINDYGKKYCRLVFLVLSGFCAVICGLLLFFKICNCVGKIIKLIIHILWNILAIFTIVCFLIGGIIGLFGKIGKDLVDVMAFVTSDENLNSENPILINKVGSDVSKYLKTCLSGNGDLAEALELKTKANSLEELNNLRDKFVALKNNVSEHQESEIPTEFTNEYLKKYYEYTFRDKDSGNNYDINQNIKSINDLTVNKPDGCGDIIDEKWSYKETENGYTKPTTFNDLATNNSHELIYIYDIIDEDQYNNRYNGFCSSGTIQSNVNNNAEIFVKINDFFNQDNNMFTAQDNIKDNMDGVYINLNKVIDSALLIINEITNSLNQYVGESGSVWNLLNCTFMGKDLNILLRNLDTGLGDKFLKMGTEITTLAILQAIGIVLTLITLNANSEDNKDKKNKNNPPKKTYIKKIDELESINIQ